MPEHVRKESVKYTMKGEKYLFDIGEEVRKVSYIHDQESQVSDLFEK